MVCLFNMDRCVICVWFHSLCPRVIQGGGGSRFFCPYFCVDIHFLLLYESEACLDRFGYTVIATSVGDRKTNKDCFLKV